MTRKQLRLEGIVDDPFPATTLPPDWETLDDKQRSSWCEKHKVHYPYEDKGPITPELLYWIAPLLETHPFRFAKTQPKNPHWYTLRKEWADVGDQDYSRVNEVIRDHGETDWFWKMPWRKLKVNGFQYWNWYSSPLHVVDVLNRVPYAANSPWDDMADVYDTMIDEEETKLVMDIIGDTAGLNVLDIGCGTGRFLDATNHEPNLYTGVDPSPDMLNRLIDKHPAHALCLVNLPFEEWVSPLPSYDLIVVLFEAGSQIRTDFVEYLPNLTAPNGRWVVMIDATSLMPDLPGDRIELDDYVVISGART